MQTLDRILDFAAGLCMLVGGVALTLMMVQVAADVTLKYLINWPVPATLETVSSYYMVAVTFLPLGAVTREKRHIVVAIFTERMAPRRLAGLVGAMSLVAAAYVSVLLVRTADHALGMTQVREVWETAIGDLEVWPSRWFVPAGCAVMAAFFVLTAIDEIAFAATGRRPLGDRGAPDGHSGEPHQ